MMPIGPLMVEHRLIERMINLLASRAQIFKAKNAVDTDFVDTAVDFLKTYADRCHHGKEEDILFRELKNKQLAPEHKTVLEELLHEHVVARAITRSLAEANARLSRGERGVVPEMVTFMEQLSAHYLKHIEKEDKHFFLPSMNYLSADEQAAAMKRFDEFDKKLIHERYKLIVSEAEKAK